MSEITAPKITIDTSSPSITLDKTTMDIKDPLLKALLAKYIVPVIVWSVSAFGIVTYTSQEVTQRLDKLEEQTKSIDKNIEKILDKIEEKK